MQQCSVRSWASTEWHIPELHTEARPGPLAMEDITHQRTSRNGGPRAAENLVQQCSVRSWASTEWHIPELHTEAHPGPLATEDITNRRTSRNGGPRAAENLVQRPRVQRITSSFGEPGAAGSSCSGAPRAAESLGQRGARVAEHLVQQRTSC